MRSLEQNLTAGLLACVMPFLAACNTTGSEFSSFGNTTTALTLPDSVEPHPDGEVFNVAKAQFASGNYGHAARYYERAVEVSPNNGEAWLGLAASYDRVRRFDLADRAYKEVARLIGPRFEYYNNIGYSYLLRGDHVRARANLLKAYELDPTNITVINNLELLKT